MRTARPGLLAGAVLLIGVGIGALFFWTAGRHRRSLSATIVVPTLDTPVPAGKSAVWCSTMPLAWKEIRKFLPGPLRIADPAAAERLDRCRESIDDLPPDSFYVKSGLAEKGIVELIRWEMAARFPERRFPDLDLPLPKGPIAYAYLKAGLKYRYSFRELGPMTFRGSDGRQTKVTSFGIPAGDGGDYAEKLREQITIYASSEIAGFPRSEAEFLIDPSKTTMPNQIILASVKWQGDLPRTVERVEKLLLEPGRPFGEADVLHVPELNLQTEHRFLELEGADIPFVKQSILFELNRFGAELESEGKTYVSMSLVFDFDRPFLIYLRKRGGARPFFVLWVENAELLSKA